MLPNTTHNQNFIHHKDQNFIHREGEQREQLVVDVSGVVVTNERLFDVELFINSPNKDMSGKFHSSRRRTRKSLIVRASIQELLPRTNERTARMYRKNWWRFQINWITKQKIF